MLMSAQRARQGRHANGSTTTAVEHLLCTTRTTWRELSHGLILVARTKQHDEELFLEIKCS
jgi:hypothetical protein